MTWPGPRITRPSPRAAGVTLLEVALAVALSVGIIGTTMAFYHHALNVRARLEQKLQAVESNRRVMDRITAELRAANSYPFLGMDMSGTSNEITFITVGLPGAAAWAVREDDEDPIPPTHDLTLVSYKLQIDEELQVDEDNPDEQSQVVGLARSVQKVLSVEVAEESGDIETALLSPYIRFIGFRYWQDGDWTDSWAGQGLPKAVEITLGAEPLEEDAEAEDYGWEVFRRVVYIPASSGVGGRRRGEPDGGPGQEGPT